MQRVTNLQRGGAATVERQPPDPETPDAPFADGRGRPGAIDVGVFGYLSCDLGGKILEVNATLAGWLGIEAASLQGRRHVASVLEDDTRWRRWQSLREPAVEAFDLRTGGGRAASVRAELRPRMGAPGGIEIFMVPDLGDELIARIARLEAALTLTAGTVHDVNNVLTVLSGNLFLLTESVRGKKKLYEQARRARNAAERGSTLLRELLTFNRETDHASKAVSPGDHALALEPLLKRVIGADNEIEVSVAGRTGSVLASAAQLESVLINLVINARDALRARGRVEIRVQEASVDESLAGKLKLVPGRYVAIRVIDNGSGIPKNILHRVTEPLFSTKPRDGGSGLGLAMVRRFAEQADGALHIESREGEGTSVTVWLPRSEQLAETTANMTLPLSTMPGGDERLWLVSRDRDVRAAIQQILETLGYSVASSERLESAGSLLAGGPPPALVICERSRAQLRLERRRLDALRERIPALRHIALLKAGTDADSEAPDADAHLYRPVTVVQLARVVRDVLEKSQ